MTDTRESPAPSRAPLEQREEVSAQLAELEYLLREDPSPKRRRAAVLECAAAIRAAYPDEWAAALAPVESGTPEPVAWRYQTFGSIRWQFTDDHAAIPRNSWKVEQMFATPASGRAEALEAALRAIFEIKPDYTNPEDYCRQVRGIAHRAVRHDQSLLHPDPEKEG